jgi:hypothetical protein
MKQEYILCSAIHFDDGNVYIHQPKNIKSGYVVCGRRHHNCFMTMKIIKDKLPLDEKIKLNKNTTQGFLTSLDRFVDRKEGGVIAFKSSQIDNEIKLLFSEDLY